MFAKWLEEYRKLSRETRFISQLAAFLISVFSFLSLYDIVRFFNMNPSYFGQVLLQYTCFILPSFFNL